MPVSVLITLRHDPRSEPPPVHTNDATHAILAGWFARAGLSDRVDPPATGDPRPFTVSPLLLGGGGLWRIRITLLDDTLLPALRAVWHDEDPAKRESARRVRVVASEFAFSRDPEIGVASYLQLTNASRRVASMTLVFETPTSFRHAGSNLPLPDPVLVFSSYRARWNAFAPAEHRIAPDWNEWLTKSVGISRMDIHTERVVTGHSSEQVGFTGRVKYDVVVPDKAGTGPAIWNTLGRYAEFCATGHRTARGMGQTSLAAAY